MLRTGTGFVASIALSTTALAACPLCHTSTGAQLRAALFGPGFWPTLLLCGLPFPVLLAAAAWVYFRFPQGGTAIT